MIALDARYGSRPVEELAEFTYNTFYPDYDKETFTNDFLSSQGPGLTAEDFYRLDERYKSRPSTELFDFVKDSVFDKMDAEQEATARAIFTGEAQERTWAEAGSDTVRGLAGGSNRMVAGVTGLGALAGVPGAMGVTETLEGYADRYDEGKSQGLLQKQAIAADNRERREAEGMGAVARLGAAAGDYLSDPALLMDQSATSAAYLVPGVGYAKAGQMLGRGAQAAGLTSKTRAVAEGTGAALATQIGGGVMEGADAASSARQEVKGMEHEQLLETSEMYRNLVSDNVSPTIAREMVALSASRKAFGVTAAVSTAAGKLTSKFEADILLGRGNTFGLGSVAAVGKEGLEEIFDEGGNALGVNVGIKTSADDTRALGQGVPEAAGMGLTGGLTQGAAFKAVDLVGANLSGELPERRQANDILKRARSGNSVSPAEVELALLRFPGLEREQFEASQQEWERNALLEGMSPEEVAAEIAGLDIDTTYGMEDEGSPLPFDPGVVDLDGAIDSLDTGRFITNVEVYDAMIAAAEAQGRELRLEEQLFADQVMSSALYENLVKESQSRTLAPDEVLFVEAFREQTAQLTSPSSPYAFQGAGQQVEGGVNYPAPVGLEREGTGSNLSAALDGLAARNEIQAPPGSIPLDDAQTGLFGGEDQDQGQGQEPTPEGAPNLQPRDRGREASVAQMAEIVKDLNYGRLGTGAGADEAAPMVSVKGDLPTIAEENQGSSDTVYLNGKAVEVVYAVVEADEIVASNDASGKANPAYDAPAEGQVVALQNGRTAALQSSYENQTEKVAQYRTDLEGDTRHGVNPDVIKGMKNPVLVRVYKDTDNYSGIGSDSNARGSLGQSASETATNDAASVNLGKLVVNEDGSTSLTSSSNQGFAAEFFAGIPANERAQYQTADGSYAPAFWERLQSAVFAAAYGDSNLVTLTTEATDQEGMGAIVSALNKAAADMAALNGAEGGYDIRPAVVEAALIVKQAKSKGMTVEQYVAQADAFSQPTPLAAELASGIESFGRKSGQLGAALSNAAKQALSSETSLRTDDMFGGVPATSEEIIRGIRSSPSSEPVSSSEPAGVTPSSEPVFDSDNKSLTQEQLGKILVSESRVNESTGESETVQRSAKEVIDEIDSKIESRRKLLACVGG